MVLAVVTGNVDTGNVDTSNLPVIGRDKYNSTAILLPTHYY